MKLSELNQMQMSSSFKNHQQSTKYRNSHSAKILKISLTGGFEPPTFRLTAERSTD